MEGHYLASGNFWYDNAACAGQPFDFGSTVPVDGITLYAKWVPVVETVTLKANGGKFSDNSNSTEMTLNVNYGNSMGILDEKGRIKDEYKPVRSGYTFKYWTSIPPVTGEGAVQPTQTKFPYSRKIEQDWTLYAVWTKDADKVPVTVSIRYVDATSGQDIPAASLNVNCITSTPKHVEGSNKDLPIYAGQNFTMTAPDIAGYSHVDLTRRLYNVSESNKELVFYYRSSRWQYTVNYHIVYRNIDNIAPWVSAVAGTERYNVSIAPNLTDGTKDSYTLTNVLSKPKTAESLYALLFYKPEEGEDWMKYYSVDHFKYNGVESKADCIVINPDLGKTVDIYLTPNADAIEVKDIVKFYSGVTCAVYNADRLEGLDYVLPLPASSSSKVTTQVHYIYYDTSSAETKILNPDDVLNAGTYGVRAFITVTANNKNFLVWQSDIGSSSNPPLHLYIRRRVVFMVSQGYPEPYSKTMAEVANLPGKILVNDDVDDTWNGLSGFGLEGYEFGFAQVKTGETVTKQEGATYQFSANSFRSIVGKTTNVFTYELKDNTDVNNYNFFLLLGTLEITN